MGGQKGEKKNVKLKRTGGGFDGSTGDSGERKEVQKNVGKGPKQRRRTFSEPAGTARRKFIGKISPRRRSLFPPRSGEKEEKR